MDSFVNTEKSQTKQQKAKRKRDNELADIRHILATKEGRRFIWRILSEANIFHDSYVHGDNGYATTRNVGRASIGQWVLFELMEADSSAFEKMQREHNAQAGRDNIEQEKEAEEKNILSTNV